MSAGLSSILHLTHQSLQSQRSIFNNEQCGFINVHFYRKLAIQRHLLESELFPSTIKIVQNTLSLSGNYNGAIEYVDKLKQKYSKVDHLKYTTYAIIKHILKIMDNYSHLLHDDSRKNIRENDYLRLIWSYNLELLFLPKGAVRVVTGESKNAYNTQSKQDRYPEEKSIHGFKIGVRLVVNVGREGIDPAVGECAKNNDDKKAIMDNSKLLRECKDALDGLIRNLRNTNDDAVSYMIQITGSCCALSTMHLASNGLYVAKHRHTFNIPSSFDDLGSLAVSLAELLTMKKEMQVVADKVISQQSNTV